MIRLVGKLIKSWVQTEPIVARWVLILFVYSLVVLGLAIAWGYIGEPEYPPAEEHLKILESSQNPEWIKLAGELENKSPDYKSYFEKPNWFLYPLFVLIIGLVLYYIWHPYQFAWKNSLKYGPLLFKPDGEAASEKDLTDITGRLKRIQQKSIWLAIVGALIWTYCLDIKPLQTAYLSPSSFAQQLSVALSDPDFTVKWIFEIDSKAGIGIGMQGAYPPVQQWLFTCLIYIQQTNLIALSFLVLFRILIQIGYFVGIEFFTEKPKIRFHINPASKSKDFGLSDWNTALDKTYWMISLGICIAIISAFSQPEGEKDMGQLMGIYAMGIVIFFPFLITVFGRTRWVDECRERVMAEDDPVLWESFHEQSLWPMDPKKLEKIGVLLCFVLYAIFSGIETANIIF